MTRRGQIFAGERLPGGAAVAGRQLPRGAAASRRSWHLVEDICHPCRSLTAVLIGDKLQKIAEKIRSA